MKIPTKMKWYPYFYWSPITGEDCLALDLPVRLAALVEVRVFIWGCWMLILDTREIVRVPDGR
jgi:hypothetical protein